MFVFFVDFREIYPDIVEFSHPLDTGHTTFGNDRRPFNTHKHLNIGFQSKGSMGLYLYSTITEVQHLSRSHPLMKVGY